MSGSRSNIPPYDLTPRVIAQDERLSPEALGLLIYLRSLVDTWVPRPGHLRSRFSWGKDKYQRIMKELVTCEYVELVKGGPGGGSEYALRVLAEDEVLKSLSTSHRARDPTSESRKNRLPVDVEREPENPTVGKPDSRKSRLSIKEYIIPKESDMYKKKVGSNDGQGLDLSFLKLEGDLFYAEEITRVLEDIADPCMIWTNQTGKFGAGAAPFSVIAGLVSKHGLEVYAAGVVIGANESKNMRISIKYCSAIMDRLSKQRKPDRGLDLTEEELDGLGSQFDEL